MRYLASLHTNKRFILKVALAILFVLLGIYFIKHEKTELVQVKTVLLEANQWLVFLGVLLVLFFVFVQGWMYQFSFRAVQKHISLSSGILIFLKRNFISVFIPAGMITNMFFFNKEIEDQYGIDKTYSYYASTIFSICSIASSILLAIPALFVFFLQGGVIANITLGMVSIVMLIGSFIYIVINLKNESFIFRFLEKKHPNLRQPLQFCVRIPSDVFRFSGCFYFPASLKLSE